jgi:hypothetical protein
VQTASHANFAVEREGLKLLDELSNTKGGRTIVLDKKEDKTMVCGIAKKELKR